MTTIFMIPPSSRGESYWVVAILTLGRRT